MLVVSINAIKEQHVKVELEFSPGCSNKLKLRDSLAKNLIRIAVQYFEFSGNIAFKLLIRGFLSWFPSGCGKL